MRDLGRLRGCLRDLPVLAGHHPAFDRHDALLRAGKPNLIRRMRRVQDSRAGHPVSLPAVGTLVNEPAYAELVKTYGRERVVEAIRQQIAAEREGEAGAEARDAAVAARLRALVAPKLRRVINAPGVILHTNLGRAPLAQPALDALAVAGGYSNLELDLETGRRGERAALVADLLTSLVACQA